MSSGRRRSSSSWYSRQRWACLASTLSRWLCHERVFALSGDIVMIPTTIYEPFEGRRALDDATTVFEAVSRMVSERDAR